MKLAEALKASPKHEAHRISECGTVSTDSVDPFRAVILPSDSMPIRRYVRPREFGKLLDQVDWTPAQ